MLLCGALRSRVRGCDQLPHRPDRIVVKPHLATADEMDHCGDDFQVVLGHFAYRLDDIKKR